LKRREEMGREQLDRTKRFTDDGKLRGIISSAKFVSECSLETDDIGFGQLFKARGRKDEEVERELDVFEDEKSVKKRRIAQNPQDNTGSTKVLDFIEERTRRPLDGTQKRKRSKIVVLKVPPQKGESSTGDNGKKRRRVQFVDI
jgi:hypothetical protein